MDICGPPLPRAFMSGHTSKSWALESALRALIRQRPTFPEGHAWTQSMHSDSDLKPTLTSLHDPGPTLRAVATAYSIAIIVSLVALLLIWKCASSPTESKDAALSEATILRIHEIASRQPYPGPPDDEDGEPGTFPALPFFQNPRRQGLFIFWLFFLLVTGAAAYLLSPFWAPPVSRHITEQHNKLAWMLTLCLSVVLANISDRFCHFAFFLVPPVKLTIHAAAWIVVTLVFEPVVFGHSASLQIRRIARYLAHLYLRIPLDFPLPTPVDRLTTLVSGAVSALGGYHLISSRVARNYMFISKSLISQATQKLVHTQTSLGEAAIPTIYYQSWARWVTRYLLNFILARGQLSWNKVSWLKLSVLLGPALILCSYNIYKYNQIVVRPRSQLQLALDPIHQELRRQAVGQADVKRLLQKLDKRFRDLDNVLESRASAPRSPSG
ncbi:hypothetical protein B0H15DRAFT_555940 [Mycena belliarum]|uniref:Uncharacterized protein n=1 Tax=Mycena belliarum TaxID=1033014 RepID=A0AAD6TXC3_9AGAR|nr:hypothetical protein B0H15DRAFT_555940 [Mycena belliae]